MRRQTGQAARPRFWPEQRRRRRRWPALLVLLALIAIAVGLAWLEEGRVPPIRERVAARFELCGTPTAGRACVVDGDTFRLGPRRIRIEGIDAPELDGACDAERRLAALSRERLRALLSDGPFTMTARRSDARDQYGRELRRVERGRQSLGDRLVGEGLARDYRGAKADWCH